MDFEEPERMLSPPPRYNLMASDGSTPINYTGRSYAVSPTSMVRTIHKPFSQPITVMTWQDTRETNHYQSHSLSDDGDSGFDTHISSARTSTSLQDAPSIISRANGAPSIGPPMSAFGVPPPDPGPSHSPTSPVQPAPTPHTHPHRYSNASSISNYSPPGNITYIFKTTGMNSMALIPVSPNTPRYEAYRVEVVLNCFNPMSHISKVSKSIAIGSEVYFEPVAEFEMGISAEPARIQFRGSDSCEMIKMFYSYRNAPSRNPDRWCWKREHNQFDWEITTDPMSGKEVYKCFRHSSRTPETPLATLAFSGSGNDILSAPTTLWVSTVGREIIDDIFVSALLAERKRLSPRKGNKNETLFNHKDHRELKDHP